MMNAANILTFSRFVLTPFFIVFFLNGMHVWAFTTFCVASFTDLIDGTVARLFGQPSKWGALLDPIADKFLVQSCFLLLLLNGFIPWWLYVLALGRDLMIVGGAIYLECKQATPPYRAIWASKIATVFQLLVAIMGILLWWSPWSAETGVKFAWWQSAAIIIAAVLIVVSGLQYIRIGLHVLRERHAT